MASFIVIETTQTYVIFVHLSNEEDVFSWLYMTVHWYTVEWYFLQCNKDWMCHRVIFTYKLFYLLLFDTKLTPTPSLLSLSVSFSLSLTHSLTLSSILFTFFFLSFSFLPHLGIYFLLVCIPLNTFLYKLRHISLSDEGSKKETQLLLPPYNTFWMIVHKGIYVLYKNYLFASRSFSRVSSRYTMVTILSTLQQNVEVICVSSYAILIVSKITRILYSWWCIIFVEWL